MKAIKKILAVIVCLCVLCVSLVMTATAEGTGKITIQNPSNSAATVAGKEFQLYKVFDATVTADGKNIAYSWHKEGGVELYKEFFFGDGDGYNYLGKDTGSVQEAVEAIAGITESLELSRLAESLYNYVKGKAEPHDTVKGETGDVKVEFTNLEPGYYLVYDNATPSGSSVRSAVMLKSVKDEVVITLKANRPQIEKYVLENDNTTWGKATSVEIGEIVDFKIETLVPSHTMYENYAYYIEDVLPDGLTLNKDSIKVYQNDVQVGDGWYTLDTEDNANYDFKIDFTGPITDKFKVNDLIKIEYTATVNGEIVPHVANVNKAKLFYHNDPTVVVPTFGTSEATANVYTYMFVLTKFSEDATGNFSNHTRLAGAKFKFYKEGSDEPIKFIEKTVNGIVQYHVAPANTTEATVTEIEVIATGTPAEGFQNATYLGGNMGDITLFGLAEGVYEIEETVSPDGYILPDSNFKVTISDSVDAYGTITSLQVTGEHSGDASIGNTGGSTNNLLTWADIANATGESLPETGGMGTTLFTVIGVALMAGAVAFFTSRKRSSMA